MGRSLRSLKLGMPSSHYFLHQSFDGWIRICNSGGRLVKQVLIGQTLDIRRHRFTYTEQSYAAQKLKSAQQTQLPKPMKGLSLFRNLNLSQNRKSVDLRA